VESITSLCESIQRSLSALKAQSTGVTPKAIGENTGGRSGTTGRSSSVQQLADIISLEESSI
jgi:hypothetical protein